jgi:hypothetical protein
VSRRRLPATVAVAASLLSALLAPATAPAVSPLAPLNLEVTGGTRTWHAENDFGIEWNLLQPDISPQPSSIHYRITNRSSGASTTGFEPWAGNQLEHLQVRAGPGRYTLEVWLQTPVLTGPSASTELLFDDAAPEPPRPLESSAWTRGDEPVYLRVEAPMGPQPLSGIRGYALSVDPRTISSPCQDPGHCDAEEIDLPYGPGPKTISLGFLPEGVHIARVAAVSGAGVPSLVRNVNLRVDASPPAVVLGGVPGGWANRPVRLHASATDRYAGMAASGPGGPFTAIAVDGAPAAASPGGVAATTVLGEGVHVVSFYARDAAGNVSDSQADAQAPVPTLVRIDASPPRVAFVPGQDPAEPERIEATVEDPLSGPSAKRGVIEFRAARSRQQFQPISATIFAGRLIARWDSESRPPGSYEFRATGYDAAGNSASSGRRANGTRMVLVNPLKRVTALRFGFGDRRPERFARRPAARVIPYGRGVLVSGRLVSGAIPLAGQQVELVETFAAGAEPAQRSTIATTGEDGGFQARLTSGPSRGIEARFAGNRVLSRSRGRALQLLVPSAVRLRSSSGSALIGGPPLVFSGRIGQLNAPVPPTGLAIELQFRLGESNWNEFRTVQTDRHGRFRYRYAFTDDDSRGVRFQFRAFVPAQANWPYAAGSSRPVIVSGR